MEGLIIKIDWPYFLGIMGSLIAIAWYSSGRFTRTETFLEDVKDRLTTMEGKINGTFQSLSPISLTVKGENLLNKSDLKKYIDENKEKFFAECHKLKNIETPYDVQNVAFDFFDKIDFEPSFEKKLKEFAYEQGVDINSLRRVAGIYLRDIFLKELHIDKKDIDIKQ
jgi:hypothetical protein